MLPTLSLRSPARAYERVDKRTVRTRRGAIRQRVAQKPFAFNGRIPGRSVLERESLRRLLLAAYGNNWWKRVSRDLGCALSTVYRWLDGKPSAPPQVIAALQRRARRRLAGLDDEYRAKLEADRAALIDAIQAADKVLEPYVKASKR